MRRKNMLEMMDLEGASQEVGLRIGRIEVDLQRLEFLDLEQKDNICGRVIHKMWKRLGSKKSDLDRERPEPHSARKWAPRPLEPSGLDHGF